MFSIDSRSHAAASIPWTALAAVGRLRSNEFDLTTIDLREPILLAGVAPIHMAVSDVATPFVPMRGKTSCLDCTTARMDGFMDLVLLFDNEAIVKALGPVQNSQCVVLKIRGKLQDGRTFEGEDVVRIRKPR